MFLPLHFLLPTQGVAVYVGNSVELRSAASKAVPGTQILLRPGEYVGGIAVAGLHGTTAAPITIGASDPQQPPVIVGGGSGMQLSQVSHLVLRDMVIREAKDNGLNVDDGGSYVQPSHHVTLRNIRVSTLPAGNHDGIKMSGIDDFRVESCRVEKWGGSAIDMVGCHRGVIEGSEFRDGGDSGVQCKGGSADITISRCRFVEFGERGVNAGGSTGLPFFRPPIGTVAEGKRYEAKNIVVVGNTFDGGGAAVTFVGVDGAAVRFNTIHNPGRWAFRILQETATPDFVPSRRGRIEDNLIVFRSDRWSAGGVNVGSGTDPESFRFARNFWFCADRPQDSTPRLPTPEVGGVYSRDPKLREDLSVAADSPALRVGAHAAPRSSSVR